MMEGDGSEQKEHLDLAEIKAAHQMYILQKSNFKPKQVPEIVGITILLFGLLIEALLLVNYKPSSCTAVEVPSFFECGSDGLILIGCIILSIPLFLITTIGKSNYKKWKIKTLQELAKISNFSKSSMTSKHGLEMSILSHIESLFVEEE
tara:strand:+ start:213 stop:659 length:447 start_codon:yes stop_codon:yes gene_type:complete